MVYEVGSVVQASTASRSSPRMIDSPRSTGGFSSSSALSSRIGVRKIRTLSGFDILNCRLP